jgi:hypothetical protein
MIRAPNEVCPLLASTRSNGEDKEGSGVTVFNILSRQTHLKRKYTGPDDGGRDSLRNVGF